VSGDLTSLYDIFISYPTSLNAGGRVGEFRLQLIERLRDLLGWPVRVFLGSESLRGGQKFRREITDALDQAYVFIPTLCPAFYNSEYCIREARYFIDRLPKNPGELAIIPLLAVKTVNTIGFDKEQTAVRKKLERVTQYEDLSEIWSDLPTRSAPKITSMERRHREQYKVKMETIADIAFSKINSRVSSNGTELLSTSSLAGTDSSRRAHKGVRRPGPKSRLLLVVVAGPDKGKQFPLDDYPIPVGRSQDNTLVLNDTLVSRNHAQISFDSGGWYLADLSSRNGTEVCGRPVTKREYFEAGCYITIGKNRIEIHEG
jgi:hypothetical protein